MAELTIWAEKYRPTKLSDIINQRHVVERVKAFVKEKNIPHMLFAGPAGTGKCVSKDTPIFLADGRIVPINKVKKCDEVLSLDSDGLIKPKKVVNLTKRKDKIIKIKTRLGNEVEVTPEHPFLVLEDGIPKWKEAVKLKENDFIATPLILPVGADTSIDFRDVDGLWAELKDDVDVKIQDLFDGVRKLVLEELIKQENLTNKELAQRLNFDTGTISWATKNLCKEGILKKQGLKKIRYSLKSKIVSTNRVPIKLVKNKEAIVKISYKGKFNGFSAWVKPFYADEKFYEWLGYLLAEGSIESSRLIFHNKNKILLDRFSKLTQEIFSILPVEKENCVIIKKAATITKILQEKFGVCIKKSYNTGVPTILFGSSREKIASFIRSYFDGDGSISNNQIEIISASKKMLIGLKILLLYLGIISRVSPKKVNGRIYYKLTVSGQSNIRIFKEKIGSLIWLPKFREVKEGTVKDVMEINPKLLNHVLRTLGISYTDVLRKNEIKYVMERKKASRNKIQKIYSKVVSNAREKLSKLLDVYFTLQVIRQKINRLQKFDKVAESILEEIESKDVRKAIENETDIRCDRCLEYSRKQHTPTLGNFLRILKVLTKIKRHPKYAEVYQDILSMLNFREKIIQAIDLMKISFNSIAERINSPAAVILELKETNISLVSVSKLLQIFDCVEEEIEARIFDEQLINILELFEFLSKAEVFWDRVKELNYQGMKEVYDIEIDGSHNFVGGHGPFVLHNTTVALCIARELYGKEWRQNVLSTNASDERGIDVVRGKIKDFARMKSVGEIPWKIILLDEADALTSEAQNALRRTMETYSDVTRFILVANYLSRLIEPIQSRCSVFRFRTLTEEDIKKFVKRIVDGEKLKITDDAISAIIYLSEGDLRKVANLLQASAALGEKITESIVYDVASQAKPGDVKEMLELVLNGKFEDARKRLHDMLLRQGLAGSDIIAEIHKQIYSLDIPEDRKIQLIEKCGEYEYRLSEGSNELIQLEALLAQFLLSSRHRPG
jgi:DNA polymerase III delta prime subunit